MVYVKWDSTSKALPIVSDTDQALNKYELLPLVTVFMLKTEIKFGIVFGPGIRWD